MTSNPSATMHVGGPETDRVGGSGGTRRRALTYSSSRRIVAVAAILIGLLAPMAFFAPGASAAPPTSGLTAPGCYRHGAMFLKKDCSARDLWNQRIKPALDSGNRARINAAIATVLGPPAQSTGRLTLVTSIARPECAARGINDYLKLTVSRQKSVSAGAGAFDALSRAASGGGTASLVSRLVSSYRTAYNQLAAAAVGVSNQAAARNILTGIGFCSV